MSKQMCINYKKKTLAVGLLAICYFFFLVQALETILKSQIPIRVSQFKETLFDVCVNMTIRSNIV